MDLVRLVAARPGVVSGIGGFAVGFPMGGLEAAVLATILGFFAGKSLRSTLWAFGAGDRP